MTLLVLILIPLLGGLLAWLAGRRRPTVARVVALVAACTHLVAAGAFWGARFAGRATALGQWRAEVNWSWIPPFGVRFHLAADGLSALLVLLTAFLGVVSVACSWREIRDRVGFYHFTLLWVLAGITGVFLALDLFLFYFFWEMMLVPMYFLFLWGHEGRVRAAIKFFLFTQLSGLLMLVAIVALHFVHARATGRVTFDYGDLLGASMGARAATWLMLGFFIAFAVKLPAVPFHTWLPDAHTQAPTAGSVVLAGLLLKTGAYGLVRFVVPLFPQAAADFAPVGMVLGVVGILYGAVLAFAQTDLKRLVAYTSVSHLGFVLLGVFAWAADGSPAGAAGQLALQGAVLTMVCHGLSTGALFVLVGALSERLHTREMDRMGGLWAVAPRMGGLALFFSLASLGLPGLGNFAAEFLVLLGAWRVSVPLTAVAAVGLVLSAVYALWMMQRVFHGPRPADLTMADVSAREAVPLAAMLVVLVVLGLYPRPILQSLSTVDAALGRGPENRVRPYFSAAGPQTPNPKPHPRGGLP
jgi:NADH-quinone oxidoreductase subunit M